MNLRRVGVDLAKNVYQLHGVDRHGKTVWKLRLRRGQWLQALLDKAEPGCEIGMEACTGAHHWARELQSRGYTVRLIAPQFVKPYVKANKTDAADAEAICEAVTRPTMRFVPIKNAEQQAILSLHRARQGFVRARTAQANQLRGLLTEYGITLPQGISHVANRLPEIVECAENEIPGLFQDLLQRLVVHLRELNHQVQELEAQIDAWHRDDRASQKLARIPGVGPLTASALSASIGDAKSFRNGRELAAWLGLVPRQHSSGGKPMLLGISKRGDAYLRTLMIHGARSVVRVAERKSTPADRWSAELLERRHTNVVAVARANKNARIVWALLAHDRDYHVDYESAV